MSHGNHQRRHYGSVPKTKPKPAPQVDRRAQLVCAKKNRYPDELTARAAGCSSIGLHANTDTLYAYRCSACRGWHLTRFPCGLPITADDPVAEAAAHEQLLGEIRAKPVTTWHSCAHGEQPGEAWKHAACLALEQQGKLERHRTHERSIIWKLKGP